MQRSLPRRVLETFVAPRRLFAEVRETVPWMGPLIISVLVGIFALLLLPDEIFVAQAQETARLSRRAVTLTSDPATIAQFERLRIAMGMMVVRPIVAFMLAGLLVLVFRGVLRGGGEYRQYLSITTHALLITALGALVALPLQILRGDAHAQISLALFTPFLDPNGFVFQLLQGINLFTLWMVMVLALGVSAIDRRRSPAGAATILLGAYVGIALAAAVLAS